MKSLLPLSFRDPHPLSHPEPFPLREPLRGGEPRTARYSGINALMAAVLEEAMRNYIDGDGRMRREVDSWLDEPSMSSPFSFTAICEQLGLQPQAVRSALRRRAPAVAAEGRRSRGNVRATRRLA